ncbi:MAG: 1-phosphofructokinase family hexose kinase [Promethearchaeota archaeon]
MKIIAVLLNPTIDEIYEIKNFHVGGTFKVNKKIIYPVGKAISFSLGIRELTNKPDIIKVISLIGQAEIQLYSSFLKSRNIEYEFVPIKGTTRSNKTFNDPVKGTTTHVRNTGFQVIKSELQLLREIILKNLLPNDFIIFSGSIPPGIPIDIYSNLISECKEKGATTILDSSGDALIHGVKAKPTIIKPNLKELAQILNNKSLSTLNLLKIDDALLKIVSEAKILLSDDLEILLITLGKKGALCITKNENLYGIVKLEKVYDTVGSGDSFLAGFVIKYLYNESIIECFKNALACGAANTLLPGPGIFEQGMVQNLIREIKIKHIY